MGVRFALVSGSERKSTGSYYTPPSLVQELIKSALEPVLEERLKGAKTKEEKEKAILSIKVCDPACGSGHFLLATARRLGYELARVRTGEEHPSVDEIRHAKRDVIQHCLYGVDKNPLAVDLCKVALWLEGACRGEPLTFLDHHIKCGDSLVGVFDLNALADGIPDDAYKPLEGNDKSLCKELKNKNKQAKRLYSSLLRKFIYDPLNSLIKEFSEFERLSDESLEDLRFKSEYYRDLRESEVYKGLEKVCNIWTAAFFVEKTEKNKNLIPTSYELFRFFEQSKEVSAELLEHVNKTAEKLHFFHWPLEFPDVFEKGGFDVVLGNPPWEMMQLEEVQFFATRAPEIAETRNSAERKRLINKLKETNPTLHEEYLKAKYYQAAINHYIRKSGRFPLTSYGKLNTYSVFAELALRLMGPEGCAGIIVPTGIATDDTNKHFFSYLMGNGLLASLYDFENREGIFPAVHRSYKFSLLTLHRSPLPTRNLPKFVFFATRVEHLKDEKRCFNLTAEDIARINPNTHTIPIFRTGYDAELTKKIYRRVPVLVNEKTGENPWSVSFKQGLFNMSSDSYLFRTRRELEAEGYELKGNIFVRAKSDIYIPLYEAKMISQFNHRHGDYRNLSKRPFSRPLPSPLVGELSDPDFVITPWYWVRLDEVKRVNGWSKLWFLGFRRITRAVDLYSCWFCFLPFVATIDTVPIVFSNLLSISIAYLCGNFNFLTVNYTAKQKISGIHLDFFALKQLPVLPPEAYTTRQLLFIVPHVLELTYTAWDMKPFADDIWVEADEDLRSAIRRQWEENARETGGHKNATPPDWLEIIYSLNPGNPNKDACPLPPFKWDEERRARLKAELDAFFAKLYGLSEEELRYILDPQDVFGPDFPGETFRVLKEKEIKQFGEYRTKHLVLEAWEKF